MKILLTGATGALGSELVPQLVARGHTVLCIVRPNKANETAHQRLNKIIRHERAIAVSGDITETLCGVDPNSPILKGVDAFVHGAADVRFIEEKKKEIETTNIDGTRNALELRQILRINEFHYVSTTYIAGNGDRLDEEDVGLDLLAGAPRNPYEFSKHQAESLVRKSGGCISIYRPSIVVGRSTDGYTSDFNGYYGFFKGMWYLADGFLQGRKPVEEPIQITDKGLLNLPIVIKAKGETKLNLIQGDWLAETMAKLIELPARGRTYNLAHPTPMRVRDVIYASLPVIGITGVRVLDRDPPPTEHRGLARIQNGVTMGLNQYAPYVNHGPRFICNNAREDLGDAYITPPPVDAAFLAKTMTYASKVWASERLRKRAKAENLELIAS